MTDIIGCSNISKVHPNKTPLSTNLLHMIKNVHEDTPNYQKTLKLKETPLATGYHTMLASANGFCKEDSSDNNKISP